MIRPGAIGDTIVSLPAVEFLCRAATESAEVWVSPACVPLVQCADRVRSIPSTGLDLLELGLDTPARDALSEFDTVVSWYGSAREAFRDAVRDYPFIFHSALPPEGCGVPAVDWYLSQVGAEPGARPALRFAAERRDFVACQPFSGSARKNWDLRKFRELASRLDVPVEFCAGPEEELPHALRFASLHQVAEWLAGARAYVGNDSGISHLAAAVGVPVLAIFRCTDPTVWAPRGRGPVRVVPGEDPTVDDICAIAAEILFQGDGHCIVRR